MSRMEDWPIVLWLTSIKDKLRILKATYKYMVRNSSNIILHCSHFFRENEILCCCVVFWDDEGARAGRQTSPLGVWQLHIRTCAVCHKTRCHF